MNGLLLRLLGMGGRSVLPLLLAGLLVVSAWQHAHGTRMLHALETARRTSAEAQRASAERDRIIEGLQRTAREQAKQRERLLGQQQKSAAALSRRQAELRVLQNENAALRQWFDHALPDDVVRMYDFPALVGASDHPERLRDGDAVHDARHDTASER